MVLTLLAIIIAALVMLRAVVRFVPQRVVAYVATGAAALMVILAVIALASDERMQLRLPLGAPDATMHLALDPLGASFLLLLALAALPCVVSARTGPLPLAAMALTLLAADGFTVAVGLLLAGAALSWRLTLFAAACLIVALAGFADFATIRATPPDGWHAFIVWLLVLAAVGATVWLALSLREAQCPQDCFAPIALTGMAGYLLIRVLLDLCGQTQPLWGSIPLLLAGAVTMLLAPLRAALGETLPSVFSLASLHQLGMAVAGIGVTLIARAVDLPSVASLALDAAWLSLVCHVLCGTLMLLCAEATETAAGTRRLDRLGGLLHTMPMTGVSCLLGLFAIAILPPGLGFAAFWLLFQSLLAAVRIGYWGTQVLAALVAAITVLSVGLVTLSAVRVFGVAFLGRPRNPRAAVAEEAPRVTRFALAGYAFGVSLLGLIPALALLPASGWANSTGSPSVRSLVLRTGAETPGYSPVAITAILVITGILVFRLARTGLSDRRREAAWSGGFAPPPPWLPFGDPKTQYGPVSFVEPLARVTQSLLRRVARWRIALQQAGSRLLAR